MDYELLKKNFLFKDLNDEQIKAIDQISSKVTFEKEGFIINEGDKANEIYIILEGEIEIQKLDPETKQPFVISHLKAGDIIGEIALIDKGLRSASVKATTTAVLLSIPIESLKKLIEENPAFISIYQNLSRNVSKKLRDTSTTTVEALKNQLIEFQNRVNMGSFLIAVIAGLSLISFLTDPLQYLIAHTQNTTFISVPFIVFLTLLVLIGIKYSKLPREVFGLTLMNWKQSLFEGIVFTIPYMVVPLIGKIALIYFLPSFQERQLFEPFSLFADPTLHTWQYWTVFNFLYWVFVPAQEFLARGALQGPLEKFLTGKYKIILAIIASNLIFSAAHIYISSWVAFVAFAMGIFEGWLFSRTHNLIGVTISHCILGTWGLSVLGP